MNWKNRSAACPDGRRGSARVDDACGGCRAGPVPLLPKLHALISLLLSRWIGWIHHRSDHSSGAMLERVPLASPGWRGRCGEGQLYSPTSEQHP